MTRVGQRQSPQPEVGPEQPSGLSDASKSQSANLQPGGEDASDGDGGERPVREKLKKTSIANIPKYGIVSGGPDFEEQSDTLMVSQEADEDIVPEEKSTDSGAQERGRPPRKRSLEDLDVVETTKNKTPDGSLSGHARKRSRDVHTENGTKSRSRRRSTGLPIHEESEAIESGRRDSALRDELEDTTIGGYIPNSESTTADQDMQESILGPKKKRSRDQFEAESQREQKIAATDENRARKRSSEEERPGETGVETAEPTSIENTSQNGPVVAPPETFKETPTEASSTKIPEGSGFANGSIISPFSTFAGNSSVFKETSGFGSNTSNQQTQTPSSAFASSGFAALAKSSASPFSAFGASTTATSTNSSAQPTAMKENSTTGFGTTATIENSSSSGFGGSVSSGSAFTGKLSFASPASSGFGTLGGSAFGSGFGSAFGGGPKLSSFAAPTGDTKSVTGKPKPFGVPTEGEEDGSGSDEGESTTGAADDPDEEPSKFQIQEADTGEEGETTLFTNRAKLYHFQDKKWGERGTGMFKLNVRYSDPEQHKETEEDAVQGRFIMRTNATYKVILNAPIFKGMSISDPKGKKTVMFSVPIEGKLTPYMLKMGKEDEVQSLYHTVQRLQGEM